jgi:hypothetical protein
VSVTDDELCLICITILSDSPLAKQRGERTGGGIFDSVLDDSRDVSQQQPPTWVFELGAQIASSRVLLMFRQNWS